MPLPSTLLTILVCPKCKGPLEYHTTAQEALVCRADRLVFRVQDGIPVMLLDDATPLDDAVYPVPA